MDNRLRLVTWLNQATSTSGTPRVSPAFYSGVSLVHSDGIPPVGETLDQLGPNTFAVIVDAVTPSRAGCRGGPCARVHPAARIVALACAACASIRAAATPRLRTGRHGSARE